MKTLNKIVERILILIFFIMTLSVIWQVLSRYLLGTSATFTEELARYCLMWLAILGAAYMTGQREHISIDFAYEKFSKETQLKLDYLIEFFILLFTVTVFIIGGSFLVYTTFILKQTSPALEVPLGVVYSILPISGLLIVYYTINHIKQIKQN